MTAKEYLQQIRQLNIDINVKLEEIQRLRALAEKTSASIVPNKTRGREQVNILEQSVEKIIALENDVDNTIYRWIANRNEAISYIKKLNDSQQRNVLELYYIAGLRWDEVADKVGYSRRHAMRLSDQAIKKMSLYVTFSV